MATPKEIEEAYRINTDQIRAECERLVNEAKQTLHDTEQRHAAEVGRLNGIVAGLKQALTTERADIVEKVLLDLQDLELEAQEAAVKAKREHIAKVRAK